MGKNYYTAIFPGEGGGVTVIKLFFRRGNMDKGKSTILHRHPPIKKCGNNCLFICLKGHGHYFGHFLFYFNLQCLRNAFQMII